MILENINRYFKAIFTTFQTLSKGLRLTQKHLSGAAFTKARQNFKPASASYFQAVGAQSSQIETLRYPFTLPDLPDHARHKLHNEIDDCIVCNKCAEVCPVDCIEIEGIRATAPIGTTSDGTSIRIWAAKFNIDMAKCCYCGLCTAVCPTECLTMTPEYDWTTPDLIEMIVPFSKLSEQEAEVKRAELEAFNAKKKQAKSEEKPTETTPLLAPDRKESTKPILKPSIKIKLNTSTKDKSSELDQPITDQRESDQKENGTTSENPTTPEAANTVSLSSEEKEKPRLDNSQNKKPTLKIKLPPPKAKD
jgi:NADH-quinone oxidoreductase subunit I